MKKHLLNKTIENLPKIGRQRKLSDREERRLIIKSKPNPFQTANELRSACDSQEKTSVDTIKRLLRKNKLFLSIALNKSFLNKRKKTIQMVHSKEGV